MRARSKGRVLALQALYGIEIYPEGRKEIECFPWLCDSEQEARYGEQSKQFALLIVRGVMEELRQLDAIIRTHIAHWNFDRLLEVDKAILRLSLYAILYLREIPIAVTINEALELAKLYSDAHSAQFVNGVLDGFVKSKNRAEYAS